MSKSWTPGKGWHPALTKRCEPDCKCGKHFRSKEHNARIGISVALTAEAKRCRPLGVGSQA